MLGTSTIFRTIESHCFVPEPMPSILTPISVQTSGPTRTAGSSTCISGRIAPLFSASNSDADQHARGARLEAQGLTSDVHSEKAALDLDVHGFSPIAIGLTLTRAGTRLRRGWRVHQRSAAGAAEPVANGAR